MSTRTRLRLGTRSSPLARWQAEWVAARLAELEVDVEFVYISTQGDVRSGPIGNIGGQGVFTKEIQRALLANEIDLAVHSLKDLPTEPVDGLALAAVPPREVCGDALVTNDYANLDELPAGALVGTGSLRRQAQLLHARPDLRVADIRGNVETRLRKLDDGEYQAIILAEAGLTRLELTERIRQTLPKSTMLPAVGQGALGLETRADDSRAMDALAPLNDSATRAAVMAERSLLATLRGGCLAPVGAWGRFENDRLHLDAVVLSRDGRERLFVANSAPGAEAESLGRAAAESLLEQGAAQLIASSRENS